MPSRSSWRLSTATRTGPGSRQCGRSLGTPGALRNRSIASTFLLYSCRILMSMAGVVGYSVAAYVTLHACARGVFPCSLLAHSLLACFPDLSTFPRDRVKRKGWEEGGIPHAHRCAGPLHQQRTYRPVLERQVHLGWCHVHQLLSHRSQHWCRTRSCRCQHPRKCSSGTPSSLHPWCAVVCQNCCWSVVRLQKAAFWA